MAVSTSLTDAATAPQRSDPDGFRATADTFVDWLANTFVTEMQAIITEFNATFDNIWSATSTTSLTVGTGDKTFTIAESEIAFAVGSTVRISDNAAPATNYMEGTITAYTASTGSMTVSVSTSAGSGTIADWTISYIPPTGFFLAKTSNLSDLDNADTALTNLGGTATGTAVFKAASAAAARAAIGANGLASVQVFTTSGTWTRPTGTRIVKIYVTGAGCNMSDTTRSGASGGTAIKILDVSSISTSTITIGANGMPGGASSWADGTNTITGNGGAGVGSTAKGGTATGGDINLIGTPGATGQYVSVNDQSRLGGIPSYWGGSYGAGEGIADNNAKNGVVIVEEYK